jgi:hypothetical protein
LALNAKAPLCAIPIRACVIVVCTALAACGQTLRSAPTGPAPRSNAVTVIVDYPPPPAEVEVIPPDPGDPCVWIDGSWTWQGRRWEWTAGSWLVPPEGCYYARPMIAWQSTPERGLLFYAQPRFYPNDADELDRQSALTRCEEPKPCRIGSASITK